jgi:alpha-maltose-1-phosphate synthase
MPSRILYINYGSQSGVTDAVLQRLRAAGREVRVFDPLDGFLYKRRVGSIQVPNVAPDPVIATAAAMARFRRHWKPWYAHTTVAFDRLTARCERAVAAERPELVLQAGVLFAPGTRGRAPYYLYCDHTRALHEAYAPAPGLAPPMPFEAAWRRRETAVYRGAAAIFVMSEHVKRSLVGVYGIAPERVHVVGAGPNVGPQATSTPPRERAFLFVGKNFAPKGGLETLQAYAAVRARHPEAELWMVGGQQPDRAPPGVKLLGRLSLAEVARLYERAFAFVLPTLREAFGLAYLEAMSYGLPCIGSRIEAIPEIVAEGETGLLVPPRDPAALAAAMLTLLDHPERARALGEAGRRRVAERFGWDRAVGKMLEVMERSRPLSRPLQDRPAVAGEERAAGGRDG